MGLLSVVARLSFSGGGRTHIGRQLFNKINYLNKFMVSLDLIKLDIDGIEYLQLKLLNNKGVKDDKEK